MTDRMTYRETVTAQRRPPLEGAGAAPDLNELVRLGVLAASSHNTQPWKFRLGSDGIEVLPDFARRCPAVDPVDAHLFKSLGCAAENIVQGAAAQGLAARVCFDNDSARLRIGFERAAARPVDRLFPAIPHRQCTRLPFDGKPIDATARKAILAAGCETGVRTVLVHNPGLREAIVDFVREGSIAQFADPAFRKELMAWLRFNDAAALASGDGLAARTAGLPSLPDWLAQAVIGFVLTGRAQARRDARAIRSSLLLAALVAERDDRDAWIKVGRACQRLLLQATMFDVRAAFINQPVELRPLRSQLDALLGLRGETVLLLLRLGHGPKAPYSLRRPLGAVILPD